MLTLHLTPWLVRLMIGGSANTENALELHSPQEGHVNGEALCAANRNAQGPHDDTIACGRGGGSCQPVPCRGLSVEAGTCQGGTMKCCRW
uniref:Beta-defensin-like domain-containing protein n=1 Tax=Anolis carolinensis TaxID=28377 RepID=A0A803T049_ANOCA